MWKELKVLIKARLGDGSHPRRASLPRFRGQFEQLETRTVLSATIGVMAIDFEAGTIAVAVWEGRPLLPEPPRVAAFHPASQFAQRIVDNHYGDRNEFGTEFTTGAGLIKNFGQSNRDLPVRLIGHGFELGGLVKPPSNDLEVLGNNNAEDQGNNPVYAQADPGGDGDTNLTFPNTPATNDRTRFDSFPDRFAQDVRLPPPLPVPASPYSATDTTNNLGLSMHSSLGAHDAAFDEYSPESLLLAASADEDDDLDLDEDEDELKARREKAESTEESAIALVGSDAAEALDALERERVAIDAVLTELHDLNLHQGEQSTDTAQSHDQSKSAQPHDGSENYLPSDVRGLAGANFSQAEGGMVLLEPTGDANSSAYDLTAVFTGQFTRPHDVALGLEATVGLQQAFDVGSNERFETSAARAPVVQPVAQPAAATAQPSVSAENAPAKKSEQPS